MWSNQNLYTMKRVIYFLLSLLGFPLSSCGNLGLMDAYGTPYVNFDIKARVVDGAGKPIKGIQAEVDYTQTSSDAKGNILLRTKLGAVPESVQICFEDIDGAKNGGEFAPCDLLIENIEAVKTGDKSGSWHHGDYELNIGDVAMKLDGEE